MLYVLFLLNYNPVLKPSFLLSLIYFNKLILNIYKPKTQIKYKIEIKDKIINNKKLNKYQIFVKENYSKIKKENPLMQSKDIISKLGKEWSDLKNSNY